MLVGFIPVWADMSLTLSLPSVAMAKVLLSKAPNPHLLPEPGTTPTCVCSLLRWVKVELLHVVYEHLHFSFFFEEEAALNFTVLFCALRPGRFRNNAILIVSSLVHFFVSLIQIS